MQPGFSLHTLLPRGGLLSSSPVGARGLPDASDSLSSSAQKAAELQEGRSSGSLIASCTVQTLCKKRLPLLDGGDEAPPHLAGGRGCTAQAQVGPAAFLRAGGRLQGDGEKEACSLLPPPFMLQSGRFLLPDPDTERGS